MKIMCKRGGIFPSDWMEVEWPIDYDPLSIMVRAFAKADDYQEMTVASANLGVIRTYQKWTDDGKAIATGTEQTVP